MDSKEIKQRIKTANTVMREQKKVITTGLTDILKGESKDVASVRAALSTFAKASVESARFKAKL